MERVLALLYDIHGNLPALEAVLADADDAGEFLLGGDYATAGAWPRRDGRAPEGARQRHLDPRERRPLARGPPRRARRRSTRSRRAPLSCSATSSRRSSPGSPSGPSIDDTLFCHASPRSDMESFGAEPGPLDSELLDGRRGEARRVRAHARRSSTRTGPGGIELVNPAASGCRGTATTAPPTRCSTATASSCAAWSTTGRRRWPRCESASASCPRAAWSWPGSTSS